jgi:hypothetical protein
MTVDGTNSKHFYISTDTGHTWTAPAKNLPDGINYYRVAADSKGNIFAGHDDGVLLSQDGGVTWSQAANGFPNAWVTSLRIRGHYLVAATYGRGMYYLDINQFSSVAANQNPSIAGNGFVAIKDIYPSIVTSVASARMNIDYTFSQDMHAKISVFDVLGRQEKVPLNEYTLAGDHSLSADLSGLGPGQHYVVLTGDGYSVTKPFTIN